MDLFKVAIAIFLLLSAPVYAIETEVDGSWQLDRIYCLESHSTKKVAPEVLVFSLDTSVGVLSAHSQDAECKTSSNARARVVGNKLIVDSGEYTFKECVPGVELAPLANPPSLGMEIRPTRIGDIELILLTVPEANFEHCGREEPAEHIFVRPPNG